MTPPETTPSRKQLEDTCKLVRKLACDELLGIARSILEANKDLATFMIDRGEWKFHDRNGVWVDEEDERFIQIHHFLYSYGLGVSDPLLDDIIIHNKP